MASHINISCKRSKDNTEESSDRRFSAHIGFPERLYSYHIPLKRTVIFIRFVPVLYAETEVLCPHQFSSVQDGTQAMDAVLSLALCPQSVSQAPHHQFSVRLYPLTGC